MPLSQRLHQKAGFVHLLDIASCPGLDQSDIGICFGLDQSLLVSGLWPTRYCFLSLD